DPAGKLVEAATLDQALEIYPNASATTVRGLGFKRYASGVGRAGMIHTQATNVIFENNTFAQSASSPLNMNYGHDSVIRGNISIYNGMTGGNYFATNNLLFEENYNSYNNMANFDTGWEAGGTKMVDIHDAVIRDNIFEHNNGTCYWCDLSCYNVTIVRNVSQNNASHGIFYELSTQGIIRSEVRHVAK